MKIQITKRDINEMVYASVKKVLAEQRLLMEDAHPYDAELKFTLNNIMDIDYNCDIDYEKIENELGIDCDREYHLTGKLLVDPDYDEGDETREDWEHPNLEVEVDNYDGFDTEVLDKVDDYDRERLNKVIDDPENWHTTERFTTWQDFED